MNTVSPDSVFLVILRAGSYEDAYCKNLWAFASRVQAELFSEEESQRIARVLGKKEAVDKLMRAWEDRNPFPHLNPEQVEQYYLWREDEEDRIQTLIGFSWEELPNRADDGFRVIVEEVSFVS